MKYAILCYPFYSAVYRINSHFYNKVHVLCYRVTRMGSTIMFKSEIGEYGYDLLISQTEIDSDNRYKIVEI